MVFSGITERKRAEAELKESEERLRAAFEQAAVGMAYDAPDGTMPRVNSRLSGILGYGRKELLGRTFRDFAHPDNLGKDEEQVRRLPPARYGRPAHRRRPGVSPS